ncbi:MAG: hypothetical protein RBR23_06110 [Arcobacteraceae bacterium]|jgi:hypothetical protein|nr:hypothetical protein [Arcobacteraceae bacterium]
MDETKLTENDLRLVMSLAMAPTKFDKYIVLLKNDFGYNLTKSELAKVIKKSEQTIDRRIKEGMNLPNYHRSSEGLKASYIFPIIEVAEYLANNMIKTL